MKNIDTILKSAKHVVDYDTYYIADTTLKLYSREIKVGSINISQHQLPTRHNYIIDNHASIRVSESFKSFIKLWGASIVSFDIDTIVVLPDMANMWYISTIGDKLERIFIARLQTDELEIRGIEKKYYRVSLL